jgi:hypothetical protein
LTISEQSATRVARPGGWRAQPLIAPAALLSAGLFLSPLVSAEGCDSERHRQFDFWIGHWRVETPSGELAGHNRIERILDGCALQEHWQGSGGYTGRSLNTYDPASERWRQFWTDDHDLSLHLTGGWRDDRMVLKGRRTLRDGRSVTDRISWIPLDDGVVRQLWEQSIDGAEFTTAFDGRYRRVEPATQ